MTTANESSYYEGQVLKIGDNLFFTFNKNNKCPPGHLLFEEGEDKSLPCIQQTRIRNEGFGGSPHLMESHSLDPIYFLR